MPPVIVNCPSPLTPFAPSLETASSTVPPERASVSVALSRLMQTDLSPETETARRPPEIAAVIFFVARVSPRTLLVAPYDEQSMESEPASCV